MERVTKVLCIKTTVSGKDGRKKLWSVPATQYDVYCKKLVVFPKMIEHIFDIRQGESVSFNLNLDRIKERVIEIKIGR